VVSSYQWYFNGSLINGASDYYYIAPESGDYNIVATDSNGCEVEAVINNVIAGLTPALSEGDGVTAYPNPVEAVLGISIPMARSEESTAEISVYSIIGEKVLNQTRNINLNHETFLDVHSLPSGLYWLEIISAGKIFRSKFLKA
jgi:hypothetical protein